MTVRVAHKRDISVVVVEENIISVEIRENKTLGFFYWTLLHDGHEFGFPCADYNVEVFHV